MGWSLPLPICVYPAGTWKIASSKTQVILSSSWIRLTNGTSQSIAKMFPKVIRAFNTWNNGISKQKQTFRTGQSLDWIYDVPILTGKPDGSCICIKSLSLAKCELDIAIRSTIGRICSGSDNGYCSDSHSVALNFCILVLISFGLPMSRPPRSAFESKYSSGVMLQGLVLFESF